MESILITEKERIGADIENFDASYRLFIKYPVQLIQVRTYIRCSARFWHKLENWNLILQTRTNSIGPIFIYVYFIFIAVAQ